MGNFANQNGGHTAHNSFVLCLAELGIVGYMLWMGLLVSTNASSRMNSCIAVLGPRQAGFEVVPDEDETRMAGAEERTPTTAAR